MQPMRESWLLICCIGSRAIFAHSTGALFPRGLPWFA
jgi:hypothetical protein